MGVQFIGPSRHAQSPTPTLHSTQAIVVCLRLLRRAYIGNLMRPPPPHIPELLTPRPDLSCLVAVPWLLVPLSQTPHNFIKFFTVISCNFTCGNHDSDQ